MFKALFFVSVFYITSLIACDPDKCKPPDCNCISSSTPNNLLPEKTPQFVILAFDDSITSHNYDQYYAKLIENKTNPNGCPIQLTYFVSHEYTSYPLLHKLYESQQEIALHSVTHNNLVSYWKNLSPEEHAMEFAGQRKLTSKFANIPMSAITGIRVPQLQMSGENSFAMLKNEGFLYDFTWPTRHYASPGLWPYTLDYPSFQDCMIEPCPKGTYPGVWVVPAGTWKDLNGNSCVTVDGCHTIPTEEKELFDFMVKNFERLYLTNKAPFTMHLHSAWFDMNPDIHFKVYSKFLEYLLSKHDVYILGPTKIIEWVKNPIELDQMKSKFECTAIEKSECQERFCTLNKPGGSKWDVRYLEVCGNCPREYPWINNPLGD